MSDETRRYSPRGMRAPRALTEMPDQLMEAPVDRATFAKGDQGKSLVAPGPGVGAATGALGQARQVIQSEGDPKHAESVTVFFDEPRREDSQTIGGSDDCNLVAFVRWGVNGVFHLVEVDVVRGGRLTVPASQVDVQIAQQVGINGGRTDRAYRVAASAGYVPNASPIEPTRTVMVPAVGGGMQSVFFTIPPYARTLTVYRQPATSAMIVHLFDAGSNALYEENVAANATCPKIFLAQDVRQFRLTATGALAQARAVFGLAV